LEPWEAPQANGRGNIPPRTALPPKPARRQYFQRTAPFASQNIQNRKVFCCTFSFPTHNSYQAIKQPQSTNKKKGKHPTKKPQKRTTEEKASGTKKKRKKTRQPTPPKAAQKKKKKEKKTARSIIRRKTEGFGQFPSENKLAGPPGGGAFVGFPVEVEDGGEKLRERSEEK